MQRTSPVKKVDSLDCGLVYNEVISLVNFIVATVNSLFMHMVVSVQNDSMQDLTVKGFI